MNGSLGNKRGRPLKNVWMSKDGEFSPSTRVRYGFWRTLCDERNELLQLIPSIVAELLRIVDGDLT